MNHKKHPRCCSLPRCFPIQHTTIISIISIISILHTKHTTSFHPSSSLPRHTSITTQCTVHHPRTFSHALHGIAGSTLTTPWGHHPCASSRPADNLDLLSQVTCDKCPGNRQSWPRRLGVPACDHTPGPDHLSRGDWYQSGSSCWRWMDWKSWPRGRDLVPELAEGPRPVEGTASSTGRGSDVVGRMHRLVAVSVGSCIGW